jgi:hypothetical protein
MKYTVMFFLVVALAITTTPHTLAFDPQPWCDEAVATVGTSGYDVSATGWAKFARVYDLTDNVVVPDTELNLFPGASAWSWTNLQLEPARNFQVQVSKDGITYTTERCLFTPVSLGVVMGEFTASASGPHITLDWEVLTEWSNLGYNIYRGAFDNLPNATLIATVPSASPGGAIGHWEYTYTDVDLVPGTYYYWLQDIPIDGAPPYFYGPVNATVEIPTAVTLSSFASYSQPRTWKTLAKWLGLVD